MKPWRWPAWDEQIEIPLWVVMFACGAAGYCVGLLRATLYTVWRIG